MLLQVSCWRNLQAYVLLFSKKQKARKFKHYQKNYLSGILYFMFTISNLFSCLHLLINSDRLLSNISWFENLIINNFSIKHNLQKLCLGFPQTFPAIFHVIIGTLLFRFSSHTYFDSSVPLLYLSCFLSLTWLSYLSLNGVSDTPK